MNKNLFSPRNPVIWFALFAVVLGWSGLIRGPLGFLIFFVVTFGLLLCLRAVVRARAKHTES